MSIKWCIYFQGHPRLVNALSVLYSRLIQRDIHPMDEILITVGAYGALYCAVQGLINPGDEVSILLIVRIVDIDSGFIRYLIVFNNV